MRYIYNDKFGYHWIWIYPLFLIKEFIRDKYKAWKLFWFRRNTKHLDHMRRRAGIK